MRTSVLWRGPRHRVGWTLWINLWTFLALCHRGSGLAVTNMPGKRSYFDVATGPMSPAQLRRLSRDERFRASPGANFKFIRAPRELAPEIRMMAKAKIRHAELDKMLDDSTHHLRVAAAVAASSGISDHDTFKRDSKLNKNAGRAKHGKLGGRSPPPLSGSSPIADAWTGGPISHSTSPPLRGCKTLHEKRRTAWADVQDDWDAELDTYDLGLNYDPELDEATVDWPQVLVMSCGTQTDDDGATVPEPETLCALPDPIYSLPWSGFPGWWCDFDAPMALNSATNCVASGVDHSQGDVAAVPIPLDAWNELCCWRQGVFRYCGDERREDEPLSSAVASPLLVKFEAQRRRRAPLAASTRIWTSLSSLFRPRRRGTWRSTSPRPPSSLAILRSASLSWRRWPRCSPPKRRSRRIAPRFRNS